MDYGRITRLNSIFFDIIKADKLMRGMVDIND